MLHLKTSEDKVPCEYLSPEIFIYKRRESYLIKNSTGFSFSISEP